MAKKDKMEKEEVKPIVVPEPIKELEEPTMEPDTKDVPENPKDVRPATYQESKQSEEKIHNWMQTRALSVAGEKVEEKPDAEKTDNEKKIEEQKSERRQQMESKEANKDMLDRTMTYIGLNFKGLDEDGFREFISENPACREAINEGAESATYPEVVAAQCIRFYRVHFPAAFDNVEFIGVLEDDEEPEEEGDEDDE